MRTLMTIAALAAAASFGTFASAADAKSQRESAVSPMIISNVVDIAVCLLVKVCPVGGNQQRTVICQDGSPAPYGGRCSAYQMQPQTYAQPQGGAPAPVLASPPPAPVQASPPSQQ